jgi:heme/copper-type cytochrome/quinol oxidase subunit 2
MSQQLACQCTCDVLQAVAQTAQADVTWEAVKPAILTGSIVLLIIVVVIALLISFNKNKKNDDDDDEIGGQTYY